MKLATIEQIKAIRPHNNADSLEFADVLGYSCIVPKGKYRPGNWCILIQPDTVLPDAEWSAVYKAKSKRVKAIRLRGEWSFGIVEDFAILPDTEDGTSLWLAEGTEVSEVLGITKYEAPAPKELNAKRALPFGICKTDEERFQNLRMEEYYGRLVDVTLKIDGQSFTAYYNAGQDLSEGEFGVCGRTLEYKFDSDNHFTKNAKACNLQEKLTAYCKKHNVNLALRGEQYGAGIQGLQNNPHSKKPLGLAFFSCWDIDQMRYYSPGEAHYFDEVCFALDLPTVPLLEESVRLTPELIAKYQNMERLPDGDMFEGVVIVGNGFSFKVINLNYDSKK